nr:(+) mating type surface protein [Absidia glauca]
MIGLTLISARIVERTSHDNSCTGGCYKSGTQCVETNQKGAGEKTTDTCYHTLSGTHYGCLINKECVCYELTKKTIKSKQGRGYCFK